MGEISRVATLQKIDGSSQFQLLSQNAYCIGRGEQASLRIRDTAVSRVHAFLFWDGRHWVIVDCSSNGTYINGKSVHKHRLSPGDLIRLSEKHQWLFSEQLVDGPVQTVEVSSEETCAELVSSSSWFDTSESDWQVIGTSPATHALRSHVTKTAQANLPILIRGEFGVGKRHVARAIHAASPARQRQIQWIDCRNVAPQQLHSRFSEEALLGGEPANGPGMMVFEQISALDRDSQRQLLEVLQKLSRLAREGRFPQSAPRIVAISDRSLEAMVDEGRFDPDLLVRLTVVQILIDPLRDRPEDIPELARHFARVFARQYTRPFQDFRPEAFAVLQEYDWPANVRELRNTVERAVFFGEGDLIDAGVFSRGFHASPHAPSALLGLSLKEVEKRHIGETLVANSWKKSRVAAILGIERSTLDRKIKRFGLRRPNRPVR